VGVRAISTYEFPSADRQEMYGDDQLVHVHWKGNLFMCAAACFRAPRAMPWADFKAAMVDGWASSDPDYTPDAPKSWELDGRPFDPKPDQSLADLGVGHKSLISFAG